MLKNIAPVKCKGFEKAFLLKFESCKVYANVKAEEIKACMIAVVQIFI
jgi:hypothetical protein